jgi:hypothetical protein
METENRNPPDERLRSNNVLRGKITGPIIRTLFDG